MKKKTLKIANGISCPTQTQTSFDTEIMCTLNKIYEEDAKGMKVVSIYKFFCLLSKKGFTPPHKLRI